MNKHIAKRILIRLEVADAIQYYLVLDADGSITRMGPVNIDQDEQGNMFAGKTKEPLFERLIDLMPDSLISYLGNQIEMPNDGGRRCRLTIALSGNDRQKGVEWIYWSESRGPGDDISAFLLETVKLTQAWYESNLATIQG